MKKAIYSLFLLFFLPPVFAANETGIESAHQWLEIIDAGNYEESWDSTSTLVQGQLSSTQWTTALVQARQPFGDMISRELTRSTEATSLPGAPDGEYIVITFATGFEKKSTAVETVTMSKENGVWRAAGYFIR